VDVLGRYVSFCSVQTWVPMRRVAVCVDVLGRYVSFCSVQTWVPMRRVADASRHWLAAARCCTCFHSYSLASGFAAFCCFNMLSFIIALVLWLFLTVEWTGDQINSTASSVVFIKD